MELDHSASDCNFLQHHCSVLILSVQYTSASRQKSWVELYWREFGFSSIHPFAWQDEIELHIPRCIRLAMMIGKSPKRSREDLILDCVQYHYLALVAYFIMIWYLLWNIGYLTMIWCDIPVSAQWEDPPSQELARWAAGTAGDSGWVPNRPPCFWTFTPPSCDEIVGGFLFFSG